MNRRKWEYLVVHPSTYDYHDWLNRMGHDGWELVDLGRIFYTFKREKFDDPPARVRSLE